MNGYIAAAAILLLAAAFGLGYGKGGEHATLAAEVAMKDHIALDREAESKAKDKILKLEREYAAASNAVSESYEKGKKDAEATATATLASLRDGSTELQERWDSCETRRLSEGVAAASKPDANTRDREESAARIVQAAAQCDAQVRGLQDLLKLAQRIDE